MPRAVVHVQVDDVNEFSPVFREPLYKASLTEHKIYDSILQVSVSRDCWSSSKLVGVEMTLVPNRLLWSFAIRRSFP